jgi:hypothetical protein
MFNVTDEQLKQKAGMVCVTSVIVSDWTETRHIDWSYKLRRLIDKMEI